MGKEKTEKKKTAKKQLFETLHSKLENALTEYKSILGEKKFSGYLRKTTKSLTSEIGRGMKKELQRKKKEEKKAPQDKVES